MILRRCVSYLARLSLERNITKRAAHSEREPTQHLLEMGCQEDTARRQNGNLPLLLGHPSRIGAFWSLVGKWRLFLIEDRLCVLRETSVFVRACLESSALVWLTLAGVLLERTVTGCVISESIRIG